MAALVQLVALLRSIAKSRDRLALENAALRRLLKDWQDGLIFVKPETVIRWHRKGWKYYWKCKSKPKKVGRPPISFKLIHLIRRMSKENPFWGAPHIHDELALLGHKVAETTIAKYMVRTPDPDRQQSWCTFLKNHLNVTAACDFFTVPTLTFKTLYCFVVLSHCRRRIVHVAVTKNPTGEWTARQLLEAFPGDGTEPEYLIRDRDSIYGDEVDDQLETLQVDPVVTARQSPWQNGYCERVIGSIRRECTDPVIPLGERHLTRLLREYQDNSNRSRTPCGPKTQPRQF